jgi:hypothetical protein
MAEAVKSLSASNMESVRPAQVLASLQKLRSQVLQHRLHWICREMAARSMVKAGIFLEKLSLGHELVLMLFSEK